MNIKKAEQRERKKNHKYKINPIASSISKEDQKKKVKRLKKEREEKEKRNDGG